MSTGADDSKDLFILSGEIKSPPMSPGARHEVGALLRLLQDGESVGMPHSRPMPSIGARCHELRVRDADHNWRVFYRIDEDAILVIGVHEKKTQATPKRVIDVCRKRLRQYDA